MKLFIRSFVLIALSFVLEHDQRISLKLLKKEHTCQLNSKALAKIVDDN